MNPGSLDNILSGMDRGGFANPPHRDGLSGLGYIAPFDLSEVGRSGCEVRNVFADLGAVNPHFDVIERNAFGDHLHHRIYFP